MHIHPPMARSPQITQISTDRASHCHFELLRALGRADKSGYDIGHRACHRYRHRNRYRYRRIAFQSGHSIAIPIAISIASRQDRPSSTRRSSICHWKRDQRPSRLDSSTRLLRSPGRNDIVGQLRSLVRVDVMELGVTAFSPFASLRLCAFAFPWAGGRIQHPGSSIGRGG